MGNHLLGGQNNLLGGHSIAHLVNMLFTALRGTVKLIRNKTLEILTGIVYPCKMGFAIIENTNSFSAL